jgi:hypothetical protein
MTTSEIVDAYHAGAVKLETFVFRTGMPTWVTLLEVPEIAEALAQAGEAERSAAGSSSMPPPRSPSSQPPPRRLLPRTSASEADALAELAALDASEPMPFALVSARSSAGGPSLVAPEHPDPSPPPPARQPAPEAPPMERAPVSAQASDPLLPALEQSASPAFAAARDASGSSRWVWVAVVLLLLGAVAALIGPRYGLKLL